MADKPANWMDQSGELYKQWADQQQNLFREQQDGDTPDCSRRRRRRHGTPSPVDAQVMCNRSMAQWAPRRQWPQRSAAADGAHRRIAEDAVRPQTMGASRHSGRSTRPSSTSSRARVTRRYGHSTARFSRRRSSARSGLRDLAASQVLMHGAWNRPSNVSCGEINETKGTAITTWTRIDRRLGEDCQRNAACHSSHARVPRGAAQRLTRSGRRMPPAGTRRCRGSLRDAADADANGDGRSAARGVRAAPPNCARWRSHKWPLPLPELLAQGDEKASPRCEISAVSSKTRGCRR